MSEKSCTFAVENKWFVIYKFVKLKFYSREKEIYGVQLPDS